MGDKEKQEVTIVSDFYYMATALTQYQIAALTGENRSRFPDSKEAVEIPGSNKTVLMAINYPAERVSWQDANDELLKKLNALSRNEDPILYHLFPGYQPGDRFRLPSEAEQEYVVRNLGKINTKYYFGETPHRTNEIAWYSAEPSLNSTFQVAMLDPMWVNGGDFYDLLGNVWELTNDIYSEGAQIVESGSVASVRTAERAVRGGAWCNSVAEMRLGCNVESYPINARLPTMGVRLVLERKRF